ncbi:hypothetical protein AB0C13_37340 [Streptomyces sp. NPDC049099]|uniref:hypothetical protein n=1 Tax=Streptomyces sp. NPDC049099 TaxID=3155768 RepID=UPI00341DB349
MDEGFAQMNRGLKEMNAGIDELNRGLSKANKGAAKANTACGRLNEGIAQANRGMKAANKSVPGIKKGAEKLREVPDIDFDFSHMDEPQQQRRMALTLDLMPGIGNGKGIVEALLSPPSAGLSRSRRNCDSICWSWPAVELRGQQLPYCRAVTCSSGPLTCVRLRRAGSLHPWRLGDVLGEALVGQAGLLHDPADVLRPGAG